MSRAPVRLSALAVSAVLAGLLSASATQSGASTSSPLAAPSSRPGQGCSLPGPYDYPHGDERVDLDPADFTTRIDNPYFPMRPGTVLRYREGEGKDAQQIRVTITDRTTMIRGIRARVVRDVAREDGELVESTFDWYAQDSGGNIWYLGEATKAYEEDGTFSTKGSWRYGKNGAQAGVLVPAQPKPGCGYREEYFAGEAEDRATVLGRTESLRGPTGFYRKVLHTANYTPLEPDALENKFYARGVGPVLELDVSPELSQAVLVSIHRP